MNDNVEQAAKELLRLQAELEALEARIKEHCASTPDATQEEGVPVAAVPDPRTTPTMHVEQAAELFGVSRASAYKGIASGEIPSIRIGKRILVPTAAVLEMLGLRAS